MLKLVAPTLLAIVSASARATTLYVSPSGSDTNSGTSAAPLKTIGQAITNSSDNDTIIIENGTYTGPGNVDLSVANTLTIKSQNGAASTIINCGGSPSGSHGGIYVGNVGSADVPVLIQNITIENSYNSAGINAQGYVSISGCVFSNDNNSLGGAVYVEGNVSITNCTFNANSGTDGGSVFNYSVLSMSNCKFSADVSNGGNGCSFYNEGTATLNNCTFTGDSGSFEGAVFNNSSGLQMSYCTISNCVSKTATGGLYNTGKLALNACALLGNGAGGANGGAIDSEGGTAYLINCLLANNSAFSGGAIYTTYPLTLDGCTFSANSASSATGGGAVLVKSTVAYLTDDVLWGDSAPNSTGTTEICNVNSTVTADHSDIEGGFTGTANKDINPLFYGGSNYKIQTSSPCLDAGTAVSNMYYDLAGRIRHNPPSMGAYEASPEWTLVSAANSPNGNTITLWLALNNSAWVQSQSTAGTLSTVFEGSYSGYFPAALAVGPDNHIYVAWQNNLDPGVITVWNVTPSPYSKTSAQYQSGINWKLTSFSVDAASYVHLTWQDLPGQVWQWKVSPSGTVTKSFIGPF